MCGASSRTRCVPAELSGGKCGVTNNTRRISPETSERSRGVERLHADQTSIQRLVLIRDRPPAEASFSFRAARAAVDFGKAADREAHLIECVADESGAAVVYAFGH